MTAFCLWAGGFSEKAKLDDMRASPPGRYELVIGQRIERRSIPHYFTEDFWHNLAIWATCRDRGLPYGGGWATHPSVLIQLLRIFDAAQAKMQAEAEKQSGDIGRAKDTNQGRSNRGNR